MTAILRKDFLTKGLKITLFSLVLPALLIFTFSLSGSALEPSALVSEFHVTTVDKRTLFPVQWVTAGKGVLAYGAGQDVSFALVNEPFSQVSHLSFDGTISGALMLGRYAYLAQEGLGIRIIDLEVPSNPVDLGFYSLSGSTFHLANDGNLLFVGGANGGVQVFELSFSQQNMMGQSQSALIDRGTLPIEEPITAITADQGKLYVATQGKEIRIYDVSDPYLTFEEGSLPIGLLARSVAINGTTLFVGAGAEGLHVFDLSTPGKAETVATYPVPSESLYPSGRLVYLAAGTQGLHLLNAGPTAAATFDVQVAPGGNFVYSPDPVNVNTGDTVNWIWGSNFHSTTSGIPPTFNGPGPNTWDSGVHNVPFSFQHTFNTAGSFPYFCSVHFFTGTVNVSAPPSGINLLINPVSLQFGSVTVNDFSDLTVVITNQSGSAGTLTGTVNDLAPPFSVTKGLGAFSLAPGASMDITVRFMPTATGPFSDTLSITNNSTNANNPANIPVNGLGVTSIVNLLINPPNLDFGSVTVGQQADHTVTVTNQSSSTGTLTGSVAGPSSPFSLVSGGVFSLAPNTSTTIVVRFSPTATGVFNDTLTITHNGTNQNSPTNVPLVGTGVTTPVPDLVVTSLSGPPTGKPGGKITIVNTVKNQGTAPGAKAIVTFFLSADPQITPADISIGKRTISSLAAGATNGPISTSVTIPKNVPTGTYYLGAIVSDNSAADSNTITLCLALSKPTLLLPKNGGKNILSMPTLDWKDVTGASSYTVQVATDSKFTNIVASMTGLTTSQWTVTPALAGNTKYFWRVMAVNDCGPGPLSATWSFTTQP